MTGPSETHFARIYLHVFACAACVLPVASYVLSTYGWRPGDIGIATATVAIAGVVATPLWGRLDDRTTWAPRAAVLACAAAAVLAALTLGRTPHAVTWLALALFGVAEGPLDPLLTTRVLASGLHGPRLGRVRAFGSLGWVVGLGLAATVLTVWPAHSEWVWIAAAVTAVSAPASWGARERTTDERAAAERHSASGTRPRPPLRAVLGVMVVAFPTSMAMSVLVQFTAGWAHQELSAGPFLALAPIALSAALELPVFPLVDRLARSRSPLLITVLAGPPLAVAVAVLAVAPSSASMLGVQPLIAISFSLLFVGQSRMLSAAVPAERQASAQTLGSALINGSGQLLGGLVGGRLADAFGYSGLFGCLVGLAAIGTLIGGGALLRARRVSHVRATACPPTEGRATVLRHQ